MEDEAPGTALELSPSMSMEKNFSSQELRKRTADEEVPVDERRPVFVADSERKDESVFEGRMPVESCFCLGCGGSVGDGAVRKEGDDDDDILTCEGTPMKWGWSLVCTCVSLILFGFVLLARGSGSQDKLSWCCKEEGGLDCD